MRNLVWVAVAVLALGATACSPKTASAPKAAAPAAAPPAAPQPEAAATPATPDAVATPTAAAVAPADPAVPAAPAAAAPYRFSPRDFARQERRIAALIANAETRDTLGETPQIVAESERARERCATRKCVEAAYAAEEAWLRKWEGSGDVR